MRRVLLILPFTVLIATVGCQHMDSLGLDDSARIDDVMRPPPPDEPLPEGIALGEDAPPLAPEFPEHPSGLMSPWGFGTWGWQGGGCGHGTMRGPGCMHMRPQPSPPSPGPGLAPPPSIGPRVEPGGSTPGLLP